MIVFFALNDSVKIYVIHQWWDTVANTTDNIKRNLSQSSFFEFPKIIENLKILKWRTIVLRYGGVPDMALSLLLRCKKSQSLTGSLKYKEDVQPLLSYQQHWLSSPHSPTVTVQSTGNRSQISVFISLSQSIWWGTASGKASNVELQGIFGLLYFSQFKPKWVLYFCIWLIPVLMNYNYHWNSWI